MKERIEVTRTIDAGPEYIFAVLRDPEGHVDIDASGMLMAASGEPVSAVGDQFIVHMDREALGDRPLGRYDVTVTITDYDADHRIAWTIVGQARPAIGHVYGYRLEPADGGTKVTAYCDWSEINADWKSKDIFPVVAESTLKATLGILDRTVHRRRRLHD